MKALHFPCLIYRDAADEPLINESKADDNRVPWDILISLNDRFPQVGIGDHGDFACLLIRVKELYEKAKAWQDEISELTMLSLRGGKRRNQTVSPSKLVELGDVAETDDAPNKIDLYKVHELSHHPILAKVQCVSMVMEPLKIASHPLISSTGCDA